MTRTSRRPGSILPFVTLLLLIIMIFVALAIDIGLMMLARNHAQLAADVGALAGVRQLDGISVDNNKTKADEYAQKAAVVNLVLGQTPDVEVKVGNYYYDKTNKYGQGSKRFVHLPDYRDSDEEPWGAVQVEVKSHQPAFFSRVIGFNEYDVSAKATSVHRPRDVALILDFSGSMRFSSTNTLTSTSGTSPYATGDNTVNFSLNPDPAIPNFGNWASYQQNPGRLWRTTGIGAAPYHYAPSNYSLHSNESGPPIVKDFRYLATDDGLIQAGTQDHCNAATAVTSAGLQNAFHNSAAWNPTQVMTTRIIATPAPGQLAAENTFRDQSHADYIGDLWPKVSPGNDNSSAANATISNFSRPYARTVKEFLNGNNLDSWHTQWQNKITPTPPAPATGTPTGARHARNHGANSYPGVTVNGIDGSGLWEDNGLPSNNPLYHPGSGYDMTGANARTFTGFVMGPGYYGKTFFVWPPDPRNPVGTPGDPNYHRSDWRKRFFHYPNQPTRRMDDNARLFEVTTPTQRYLQAPGAASHTVDYAAILKWIKLPPRTLPPNLRAGRIVYYKHIPDDVSDAALGTGTPDEILDKRFWRRYIDFVLGNGNGGLNGGRADMTLYGLSSTAYNGAAGATVRITSRGTTAGSNLSGPDGVVGPNNTPIGGGKNDDPYMDYRDLPRSPLLHLWFGPLSMMDFLMPYNQSWSPGTCHEAQSWQLKVAVNSSLGDIEKNHPNDWVSLIYFNSHNEYATARVTLGKQYARMKNALFYPRTLLDVLGDETQEYRPFTSNWTDLEDSGNTTSTMTTRVNIPQAEASTCPEMGLWVAYNQFSTHASFNGRRGATKFVILETDGVPNTNTSNTFNAPSAPGAQDGRITGLGNSGSDDGTQAILAARRICAQDTPTTTAGYSTANNKARVHCMAFGDLFDDPGTAQAQDALEFLYNVQKEGNTSSDTPVPTYWIEQHKVISGVYSNPDPNNPGRIEKLRTALERIMQSGVQVTLIKGDGEYVSP